MENDKQSAIVHECSHFELAGKDECIIQQKIPILFHYILDFVFIFVVAFVVINCIPYL